VRPDRALVFELTVQHPTADPARSTWIGWAVLAALILIVTAVLYYARSQSAGDADARTPSAVAGGAAEVRGFRSDAWFLPDDELLGFVEIPAGPFLMGSDRAKDPQAFDNERWSATVAQGTIDLPAFYIGRYEVTIAQFGAFADVARYRTGDQTLRGAPTHPVASVSWPDALAYCRWLDRTLRESTQTPARLRQLLGDGWRIHLPTEAEWEKAARGADGRVYPWGNEPRRDRANYSSASVTPVGSLVCPECPFALFDMSGNVWEWTRSPYQPYPYDPADDDTNLEADALWVMRGGSFSDAERNVRAAVRGGADPGVRRAFIGFRVALSRPG
jgi:formylglycine-generating enzyme required for sulfatase activity